MNSLNLPTPFSENEKTNVTLQLPLTQCSITILPLENVRKPTFSEGIDMGHWG